MNPTIHTRMSLFEIAFGHACRLAPLKKILLTGILLTHVVFASFSQKSSVFLSSSDSCQVRPPQQTSFVRRAASAGAMLRVAYVIPSNRTPQPNGVANLQYAIKAGQQFFKEQMEQNGFGPKTYKYETEADGVTPLIHVVQVSETDEYLRGDLWGRAQQAASNAGISLWAPGEVWVLIPEAHLMLPDGSLTGGVALGSGEGSGNSPGLSMISSNALPFLRPEIITDETQYDGKVLPELGPYPMKQDVTFAWFEGTTFSSVASSWLGALWHETGHGFGLSHDYRNDDNFHGNLMGNGLRGTRGSLFPETYPQDFTRLEYASALYLNVSHYFNSDKMVTDGPSVSPVVQPSVTPQQGLVRISFQASDPDGFSFAYLTHGGNMAAEMLLKGTTALNATFAVPYFTQGEINRYTVFVLDMQGNKTGVDVQFNVPVGNNQAPVPFIRINPAFPAMNQPIELDASLSYDVDQNQSSLLASWDVDNDGEFDTEPSTNKTVQHQYASPGNYLIRLKLTDPTGAQTISTAVSVNIPGEKKITVESFTLIDADKDEAVAELPDGLVIHPPAWEGKTFSVRANTSSGIIERVEFSLEGPIAHHQVDSEPPYGLFGDSDGDFIGRTLLPGEYTLTATPFYASEVGVARTVSFQVSISGTLSNKTLGGAGTDQLRSVIATADGGYLLAGHSNSNASGDKSEDTRGASDYWIVKVDAQKNRLWDKTFGGADSDELRSVIHAPGGGYLLAGYSQSNASGDKSENRKGFFDYWVVKIDDQGNKLWDKTYGGNRGDLLFSGIAMPGGGYLLAGYSESSASGDKSENNKGIIDYWVVRIDGQGNKIWDRTIGGNREDELRSVSPSADGGCLVGGYSRSGISGDKSENNKGGTDYWVVKLDNQGNKVWDKTLGGISDDQLSATLLTADGGYLLAGYSFSDASGDKSENRKGENDFWVVKIDATGNKVWDKTYGGNASDVCASVVSAPDGGYLLAGYSNSGTSGDKSEASKGVEDYWALKIDDQGNKVWDKTIGGSSLDFLTSTILTPTGGYLLAGYSRSDASGDKSENSKGDYDYWIAELQETGTNSLAVVSYDLVNTSGQVLRRLNEGDVLQLEDMKATGQTIVANTTGQPGSVEFFVNTTFFKIQNESPYTLTGDNNGTYFEPWIPDAGSYTISATPYSKSDGSGDAGGPLTLHITVMPETSVLSYDIVNTSGTVLRHLNEGDVLQLDDLKATGQTIVANTTGQPGSVEFFLNDTFFKMQNESPYTLTGDNYGTYFEPWIPDAGSYTINATPYSESDGGGDAGGSLTIRFTVMPETSVLSYDIVNTSGTVLRRLNEGDVLELDDLKATGQTIVANTTGQPGSVEFFVNGTFFKMQNESPYTLTGDNYGTYFEPWIPEAGSYTLTATPYSASDAGGGAGKSLTIHLTVKESVRAVVSYDIVNTSGKVLRRLHDGDILHADDLRSSGQTIVANTTGQVGSVTFSINTKFTSLQNAAPYTLTGDNYGTYFEPWMPQAGAYTLQAIPYSDTEAGGDVGRPLTIHFTIGDNNNSAARMLATTSEEDGSVVQTSGLTIYPVPVENELFVKMDDTIAKDAMLYIQTIQGQSVYRGTYSQSLRISTVDLKSGVYVLQVVSRDGSQRLVKFIKK